jgi:predicted DNA-binding transcriptional regulator AlpA
MHTHVYRVLRGGPYSGADYELEKMYMPINVARNFEEYEVANGRKPPVAETSVRPRSFGAVSPIPSASPSTEIAKSAPNTPGFVAPLPAPDRLLNAREVAARLGVSERWVRDHTTRRSPKIRALKLGSLIRYRRADIEMFMENLDTARPSRQPRFGV